jgi:hypothetical protein
MLIAKRISAWPQVGSKHVFVTTWLRPHEDQVAIESASRANGPSIGGRNSPYVSSSIAQIRAY